jgi:hypothetical protein
MSKWLVALCLLFGLTGCGDDDSGWIFFDMPSLDGSRGEVNARTKILPNSFGGRRVLVDVRNHAWNDWGPALTIDTFSKDGKVSLVQVWCSRLRICQEGSESPAAFFRGNGWVSGLSAQGLGDTVQVQGKIGEHTVGYACFGEKWIMHPVPEGGVDAPDLGGIFGISDGFLQNVDAYGNGANPLLLASSLEKKLTDMLAGRPIVHGFSAWCA